VAVAGADQTLPFQDLASRYNASTGSIIAETLENCGASHYVVVATCVTAAAFARWRRIDRLPTDL